MTNTTTWTFYDRFDGIGSWIGYTEYINEDETLIKRIWDDDEIEIFEIN